MATVVIIGLGPGGATALLEALNSGHTVELFEKRAESEFTRTNLIFFFTKPAITLESLYKDYHEWVKTNPSYQKDFEVNTAIIETYINPRMNNPSALELGKFQTFICNLLPMLKAKYPLKLRVHGPLLYADDDLQIEKIDTNGAIVTTSQQHLTPQHIICAEGASRHIAKALGFRFVNTDTRLANRYWARAFIHRQWVVEYKSSQAQKQAEAMGYRYNNRPPAVSHAFGHYALQVPAWIMFLPSKEQQNSALQRWICKMMHDCTPDYLQQTRKPLDPDSISLDSNPLFMVEHSIPVKNQVCRQLHASNAVLIGDAREPALFGAARGAANARRAAEDYIKHIVNHPDERSFNRATAALHKDNQSAFERGLTHHQSQLDFNLMTEEYKLKWKQVVRSVTAYPVVIEVSDHDAISIRCHDDNIKYNLPQFIRFVLKRHANGFKEHFFQNLFDMVEKDDLIKVSRANEIIELLNLYVNLQYAREGYANVSYEELQRELAHLKQEYQAFKQKGTCYLYPEMSAQALFEYLKQTASLYLIDVIKGDKGEPHLVGLTQFKQKDDLCSLYEVINYHFADRAFFTTLQFLNTQPPQDETGAQATLEGLHTQGVFAQKTPSPPPNSPRHGPQF